MDIEEKIMNDPAAAAYCDPSRGWINETFKDGAHYGISFAIEKAVDILIDMSIDAKIEIPNHEKFEQMFRKKMEE